MVEKGGSCLPRWHKEGVCREQGDKRIEGTRVMVKVIVIMGDLLQLIMMRRILASILTVNEDSICNKKWRCQL